MIGLTYIRERSGYSQRKLSMLSGVPQPIISDIENGKTKSPTVDTAIKLAKALGCTVEDLVSEHYDSGQEKTDCTDIPVS